MRHATPLLASCAFAATTYFISAAWPSLPPKLVGFHDSADTITLVFDSAADISYTIHATAPDSLGPDDVLRVPPPSTVITSNEITIPLPTIEPADSEYSITVQFGDASVELVRQSESWLQKKFGFDKPGGYTLLGRRDVDTPFIRKTESGPVEFVGKAGIAVTPVGDSPYASVRLATGLLRYLWAQPIKQGPASLPYNEFLKHPMREKLKIIREGDFAIMCAGFRDLFLHAAADTAGLKIRAVAAMNYSPQLGNLIAYSHATTEIWVPELKRWVLFDPWLGLMVTMNGVPIGAFDIQKNYDKADDMQIVPLLDEIPRFYQNGDGTVQRTAFRPASVEMTKFSCNELGCTPGYREYFQRISSSELESLAVNRWTDFDQAN